MEYADGGDLAIKIKDARGLRRTFFSTRSSLHRLPSVWGGASGPPNPQLGLRIVLSRLGR